MAIVSRRTRAIRMPPIEADRVPNSRELSRSNRSPGSRRHRHTSGVGHPDLEPQAGERSRMTGDELMVIMRIVEIEWGRRVLVDNEHLGIGHEELAEVQGSAAIEHVIAYRPVSGRLARRRIGGGP